MCNRPNSQFCVRNGKKPGPTVDARHRGAFTLIELLAVIAIITILASMLLGVSVFARRNALRGRAKADLEKIHHTLQEYQLEMGTYPETLDEVASRMPQGVDKIDPWGRDYVYQKKSNDAYTLYSEGPKADIAGDNIQSAR